MEFKIVVSDPESGKSYQREIKDDKAVRLKGLNVGDEFDGTILGLGGYKLEITGGSDKSGFPMKKGVHGIHRAMILMSGGVGYNPKKSVRKRKRVRGEKIDADIVQINAKISTRGRKDVEELLGLKVEKKAGEEKKGEEKSEE